MNICKVDEVQGCVKELENGDFWKSTKKRKIIA
jgi:hypothetical protein